MAEDTNFTPDMINNIVNMLKNNSNPETSNTEQSKNESNNNIDLGDILSKISSNSSNNSESNSSSIDFETIMKIKSIIETFNNKNDPKANLLYSLKPYLRKSKQDKLDQYVNLMKFSQVTNLFKNEKGDLK